jgi:hypothetical protein
MTWLKLSDDFADKCADLSDAAFRTHTEGLIWTMRRENGGRLSYRDARRALESLNADDAIKELVACGYWTAESWGWQIRDHMESPAHPRRDRQEPRADRAARNRKYRESRKRDASRDASRDESQRRDSPGLVWSGLDREVQETNPALEEDASSPASHDDDDDTAGF